MHRRSQHQAAPLRAILQLTLQARTQSLLAQLGSTIATQTRIDMVARWLEKVYALPADNQFRGEQFDSALKNVSLRLAIACLALNPEWKQDLEARYARLLPNIFKEACLHASMLEFDLQLYDSELYKRLGHDWMFSFVKECMFGAANGADRVHFGGKLRLLFTQIVRQSAMGLLPSGLLDDSIMQGMGQIIGTLATECCDPLALPSALPSVQLKNYAAVTNVPRQLPER